MDRPKALQDFTLISGIIKNEQPSEAELPNLVNQLVDIVGVIHDTNKKPPCPDCRARRLCVRNLAVPVITQCETCDKEVVFVIPAASQDETHWNHPVSRIAQNCPRAVRKRFFAKCPVCMKYPARHEQIQKLREKWHS